MPELGQRLGAGRAAEVFAYGDGKAIKLLLPGGLRTSLEREAAAQRAAAAAGLTVPAVDGLETVDGRHGLVMQRIHGRDSLSLAEKQPWRLWSIGRRVGRLHRQLAHLQAPEGFPSLLEAARQKAEHSPRIPEAARPRIIAALQALPEVHGLCHFDFHPGNVIESPAGPVVIDFSGARAGAPLADHARSTVIIEAGALQDSATRWERFIVRLGRRAMLAAYRSGYRAEGKVDAGAFAAWRVAAICDRLDEGVEGERPQLLRMLSRALRDARA